VTDGVLVRIVRHGESTANLERVMSHRVGHHPLTELGRRQAALAAAILGTEIDGRSALVVTSPLVRARETAAILAAALGAEVIVDEGFRELDVGTLDGRSGEAAWAEHDVVLEAWEAGDRLVAFAGGESLSELLIRFGGALRRSIAHAGDRALVVVSHGGIVRMGVRGLWPALATAELDWVRNCSISELFVDVDETELRAEIRAWGRNEHLAS
jgi:probable phosphoglycerate mutase